MFKKLIIYLLLITSVVFATEVIYAQYSNVSDVKSEDQKEDHDEKKLEKVLTDYNESQKTANQNSNEVKDVTDEELTEEELREFDQFANEVNAANNKLKNLPDYKKAALPKDLEGRKLSENIGFMLLPLQKLTPSEVEKLLRDQLKGSAAEKIFDFEPRLYTFVTKLIRDKEALPLLVRIIEDRSRLATLLWLMLGSFVVGYFLKRITSNKDQPFVTAVVFGIVRMFFMFGLRISIIWWLFSTELKPTVRIVKEVFFS